MYLFLYHLEPLKDLNTGAEPALDYIMEVLQESKIQVYNASSPVKDRKSTERRKETIEQHRRLL